MAEQLYYAVDVMQVQRSKYYNLSIRVWETEVSPYHMLKQSVHFRWQGGGEQVFDGWYAFRIVAECEQLESLRMMTAVCRRIWGGQDHWKSLPADNVLLRLSLRKAIYTIRDDRVGRWVAFDDVAPLHLHAWRDDAQSLLGEGTFTQAHVLAHGTDDAKRKMEQALAHPEFASDYPDYLKNMA